MTNHREVWEVVANYLKDNSWYQDGDDPAIWVKDGESETLGDALVIQLASDGFEWPYI